MPGTPRRRVISAELRRRANEYFGDTIDPATGEQFTTLDYVCGVVASGGSMLRIAQEMTVDLGFTVHREQINKLLAHQFGEEKRDTELARARAQGANAMAEQALEIADEHADTSVEVARAGNRIRSRQWMAERTNRALFGNQSSVNLAISIDGLHLDALRLAPPSGEATHFLPTEDAEVLSIEPAEASQTVAAQQLTLL